MKSGIKLDTFRRRRFLTILGIGLSGTIAGCTGAIPLTSKSPSERYQEWLQSQEELEKKATRARQTGHDAYNDGKLQKSIFNFRIAKSNFQIIKKNAKNKRTKFEKNSDSYTLFSMAVDYFRLRSKAALAAVKGVRARMRGNSEKETTQFSWHSAYISQAANKNAEIKRRIDE